MAVLRKISILLLVFCSLKSYSVELKSRSVKDNPRIQNLEKIRCSFVAISDSKKIRLNSEVFKITDLNKDLNGQTKGIYVNIFDFLGFSFYLDAQKRLNIRSEQEESSEKQLKTFTRLPANFNTKVSFSSQYNSKPVYISEVKIECKP